MREIKQFRITKVSTKQIAVTDYPKHCSTLKDAETNSMSLPWAFSLVSYYDQLVAVV